MGFSWFQQLTVHCHQSGIGNRNYNNNQNKASKAMEYYVLLHVLDSSGSIVVEDTSHRFQPKSIICYKTSVQHSINPELMETYIRNKLEMGETEFEALLQELNSMHLIEYINKNGVLIIELDSHTSKKLNDYYCEMESLLSKADQNMRLDVMILLLHVLQLILQHAHLEENNDIELQYADTSENVLVERMIEYINDNYKGKFSLERMATELHYSKGYLCRMFKKHMSLTITEFIGIRRIGSAKYLLNNTDMTIREIALVSGFGSVTRFHNAFHEREGMTPKQYRSKKKDNL